MRRVELAEATGALAEYVRNVRSEPVLVLRSGKPIAAVVPMSGDEWEDYVVTHHGPLVESTRRALARFRAQGGSTLEDVMQRFGHEAKRARRSVRRRALATPRRTGAK